MGSYGNFAGRLSPDNGNSLPRPCSRGCARKRARRPAGFVFPRNLSQLSPTIGRALNCLSDTKRSVRRARALVATVTTGGSGLSVMFG